MSLNSHSPHPAAARKIPRQARSQQTVERILAAAAHIFDECGYAATTTNHVAEAAGVSIGSLYQYFPNKDALLVALEERHLADTSLALDAAYERWRHDEPAPDAWARAFVDLLVSANDAPLHVITYDTAPPLPHIEELTDAVIGNLSREVAHHLRRWGVRRHADLRARVLVAAAVRLVHDLAIRTPPGRQRSQIRREIIRLVTLAATPD